jgi:hypothetical protein
MEMASFRRSFRVLERFADSLTVAWAGPSYPSGAGGARIFLRFQIWKK